jgi:hypothetical protein
MLEEVKEKVGCGKDEEILALKLKLERIRFFVEKFSKEGFADVCLPDKVECMCFIQEKVVVQLLDILGDGNGK